MENLLLILITSFITVWVYVSVNSTYHVQETSSSSAIHIRRLEGKIRNLQDSLSSFREVHNRNFQLEKGIISLQKELKALYEQRELFVQSKITNDLMGIYNMDGLKFSYSNPKISMKRIAIKKLSVVFSSRQISEETQMSKGDALFYAENKIIHDHLQYFRDNVLVHDEFEDAYTKNTVVSIFVPFVELNKGSE